MTPQTLVNDLPNETCDVSDIVLLVVGELPTMTMPPRIPPSEVIHSAASPRPSRRVSSSSSPQNSSSNCCSHLSPSSPPPPPNPTTNSYPHISSSNSCPYIPFLSSSDAPPDCDIDIQAHSNLYYILVNLPGFSSQDITLATKRRRILHLVADKWGEGGGLHLFSRLLLLSLLIKLATFQATLRRKSYSDTTLT